MLCFFYKERTHPERPVRSQGKRRQKSRPRRQTWSALLLVTEAVGTATKGM